MVSIITGEVKNSLFKTGCLRISSRVAYLDSRFVGVPGTVGSEPQDDKGSVEAAIPPAIALVINFRLFVFMSGLLIVNSKVSSYTGNIQKE
jgi:hypothetical protein